MDNNTLSNTFCKPCTGDTPKLSYEEISSYLSELNKWAVNDNQDMIYKKFKFTNFNKALKFANQIGELADKKVITQIFQLVGDIV